MATEEDYLAHMLTRLEVSGFKNLVGVDVRFGPFTCIAGANGVGKSNLFDAIRFFGALGQMPLLEAAGLVRDEAGRADLRSLFTRVGEEHLLEMTLAAELIIAREGVDDLRQRARATATYLRYEVRLGLREASDVMPQRLVVEHESLRPLKIGDFAAELAFDFTAEWQNSIVVPKKGTLRPLISTEARDGAAVIRRHQEVKGGRPREFYAEDLPRTVLSSTSAVEGPTALLVRHELSSWRLLQLEPSALRRPSEYAETPRLRSDGHGLAATLRRLVRAEPAEAIGSTLQGLTNRLNDLLQEVHRVELVDDPVRQTYGVALADRAGTRHAARALSDGTLRFLALAILASDPEETGVICLEEPENGIHPERIPAMIELLLAIAMDPEVSIAPDNPPRQVIINTHAPAVVQQVPFETLLIAKAQAVRWTEGRAQGGVRYLPAPESLRERHGSPAFTLATLLPYLEPVVPIEQLGQDEGPRFKRVVDSDIVQLSLFPVAR